MTGFKDGAASDSPFGSDDDNDEGDDGDGLQTETTENNTDAGNDQPSGTDNSNDEKERPSSDGLPWIYQRNSITDGREKTVQLHLQSSTLDEQREAKAGVEQRLGESVKKADLREAALLVGLENLDEVASTLREWGYDID
ncbi:hypothetical protein G9464_17315 [Halostella sp. JP-L12]|uniref:hypothetical protein n=1 Tax=Halostella TaxID=1843185 RepID=UPI000EF81865|nr:MULTISPECIES: hypothetical protein [Halostella]NHN49334.1 hypothetical protein [Halostella sp. JP-L12]